MIQIVGNYPVVGDLTTSPSKNSTLPLISATLLASPDSPTNIIRNFPLFGDAMTMLDIARDIGSEIKIFPNDNANSQHSNQGSHTGTVHITPHSKWDLTNIAKVSSIRGSILFMHTVLAKEGRVITKLPGGCSLGRRPIDIHCSNLRAMGAEIDIQGDIIHGRLPTKRFTGARLVMKKVSVGATQGAIMVASTAIGNTRVVNAAQDPEVVQLADAINSMGGKIRGHGTHVINIEGVEKLNGMDVTVIQDRIEAGTLILIGGLVKGSNLLVRNAPVAHLSSLLDVLKQFDIIKEMSQNPDGTCDIRVVRDKELKGDICITTGHYPTFPTDLQPQIAVFATTVTGNHKIRESVFENRMQYADELSKMGLEYAKRNAGINVSSQEIAFSGQQIHGSDIIAHDLRGGCAMAMSALCCIGVSKIFDTHHIARGYNQLFDRLKSCNANIVKL